MNTKLDRINITKPVWQFDQNAKPIGGEKCEWKRLNRWQFGLTGTQSNYVYQYCQSPEQSKLCGVQESEFGYSEACGVWN